MSGVSKEDECCETADAGSGNVGKEGETPEVGLLGVTNERGENDTILAWKHLCVLQQQQQRLIGHDTAVWPWYYVKAKYMAPGKLLPQR